MESQLLVLSIVGQRTDLSIEANEAESEKTSLCQLIFNSVAARPWKA